MICFIITLLVLLGTATTGSRRAWSFSVDVPSPVLASLTAGHVVLPADSGAPQQGEPRAPGANPAGPNAQPTDNNNQGVAAAPESAPSTASGPASGGGSRWPLIILATVVLIGGVLIALHFINRNDDD